MSEEIKEQTANSQEPTQVDFKDKYLRTAADLENYRKRAERQIDEAWRYGSANFMTAILPVIDDLERGIAGFKDQEVVSFLTMLRGRIVGEMEKSGAKCVVALGQPFNPKHHEAMMQRPSNKEKGTVIEVLKTGYHYHDRLLRPAVVVVSGGPE